MKTRLENILVDCLCDTLHVLMCSECLATTNMIASLLCKYPVFSLHKAKDPSIMNSLLHLGQAWECLIIDCRISFTTECFTRIRSLPYWVPVILLTDYADDALVAEFGIRKFENEFVLNDDLPLLDDMESFSARKKVVTISSLRSFIDLLPTIQNLSIKKKLMAKMAPCSSGERALGLLFANNPLSVDEWSCLVNEPTRKFQRLFKKYTDHSPKKLIALYHAYRIAFDTMERHKNTYIGPIPAYIVDDRSKERVMEYVLSRRSQLLFSKVDYPAS